MLGLSSCKFFGKNISMMTDTVAPAQTDLVHVESGVGMSSGSDLPPTSAERVIAPPPTAGSRTIVVQPGDTLSGISRRSNVTLAALCAANGIDAHTPIRVGQQLRIPASGAQRSTAPAPNKKPAAPAKARSYTVKPGETLSGIAARHHVSTAAILKANNMTREQANRIRAGQVLRIPAAK